MIERGRDLNRYHTKQRRAHDSMYVGALGVGAALRAGRSADGLAVLSSEGKGARDATDGREMPLMGGARPLMGGLDMPLMGAQCR